MLFTSLKGYTRQQLLRDVISGIIVAIIALPLSIALALASGVGPEEGLYTAIVAGFIISFLGGSPVQIAGPTAAFATIVAGVVAKSGTDGLMLATLMAGVILLLMAVLRLGSLIRFIPYTITTGFTAGIAVTILIGQLKDFCGITYAAGVSPVETVEKIEAFAAHIGTLNPWAILVGGICLAVLILWPKIPGALGKIPPSLIAVLVGILTVSLFDLPVNTIGDLYSVRSGLPALRLPAWDLSLASAVLPDAVTIAILAAIESLLSCVVADGMIGTKHHSNAELLAQGAGNIGSALFGGIPATGAIARTAANIKSGARTPVAGMVHAVVLLLILVVLMPYASFIPMPTIAAILFVVAYNMCQWRPFTDLVKHAPAADVLVLVITFALTIVFDLVVAIAVGMVLACVFFMKRMSDETVVRAWTHVEETVESDTSAETAVMHPIPDGVQVYEISGPVFFGAAGAIGEISVEEGTRCIVLRMQAVPAIDATGMNALEALLRRCEEAGVSLILSHVNAQPQKAMEKARFTDRIGRENFCTHIGDALAWAQGGAQR